MKRSQLTLAVLTSLCLTSFASIGQIEQRNVGAIVLGITTETDLVHTFGPPDTRVVDTHGNRLLHWTKLGNPPAQSYIPIVGPWLGELDVQWQDLWVQVRANGRVEHYTCKIHQS